jgi:hypothetical protein
MIQVPIEHCQYPSTHVSVVSRQRSSRTHGETTIHQGFLSLIIHQRFGSFAEGLQRVAGFVSQRRGPHPGSAGMRALKHCESRRFYEAAFSLLLRR